MLFLLFLLFGSYTNTAEVRGVVAYNAGVARVYPRSPAEVRQIFVRSGQKVKAGQPLVILTMAQGQGGLIPQLTEMGNQDFELRRQIELSTIQAATESAGLDQQHAGLTAAISSLERQRAIASSQIKLAESAARRATNLAAEGAGSQRQVEDSRSALLARQAELEALQEQLIAQHSALRANESERARSRFDAQRAESVLLAQRAALAEQRVDLSRSGQIVLTAPVAGVIGDISVEIGQQVTPEKSAASIIPAGSSLELWLYAPSRAVGNARAGQKVRLQFDAFPYQKFGAGEGIVTEIAKIPTEPTNVDPGLKIQEPVFRIRTRIITIAPRAKADIGSLRPGMTLSGKLVLERRNLWQILLGPMFEAMR